MSRSTLVRILKWISLIGVFGGLLMPLIFIKEIIFPFVFSKLIVFQILIGLTLPAYLVLAWMEPQYRPKKHPVYLAIAAYFVAMGLSVIFSIDPFRSWWGNQERMNGYFTLLHFFAWLTMTIGMLRTWEDWEPFLKFQAVVGGAVALTGIWQRWVNPDIFLYHAGDRVGGILDNPIYMGMYQMFMFFLLALLAYKTRNRWWWAVYGVMGLLGIAGFAAAQSRGPLVGLFVGLFAFAAFFGVTSEKRKHQIASVSVVLLAIAGYAALYFARGTEIVQKLRLDRFVNLADTASTRFIAWKIAWQGFLERPLSGWGLDAFHILFNTHYNPISLRYSLYETWFDRAHNTILDVLSMTGAFGFITYMSIFVCMFWMIYRAYKQGWISHVFASFLAAIPVAYFVQNLFVFDHPAGFTLSYLMFGLTIAATTEGFSSKTAEREAMAKVRAFPVIATTVLYLLAALLVWRASILPFRASYYSIRSSQYFGQARGLADMQKAMNIWTPYRDEQVFLLSRALVGAGQNLTKIQNWQDWLTIAKTAGQQETDHHPRNAYLRYIYARLLSDTAFAVPEQAPLAEQQYELALRDSPNRQQLYEGLSQLYLRANRTDDALAQIKHIQDIDPENGYGDWLAGLIQLFDLQKDPEGARLVYAAITKPYPYQPTNIQEMVPVFYAMRVLEKGAELDKWAAKIAPDNKTAGDGPYYQFAYQSRLAHRPDLEARFVEQVERLFPGSKQKYDSSVAQLEAQSAAIKPVVPSPAPKTPVKTR